jgi:fimbrial isopeptide formation D2 family protein
VSNINPATSVSLTVHKYEAPAVNCPNNGTLQTTCVNNAGAQALQGAKYTATQVLYKGSAIDLTTTAGWTAAQSFVNTWDGSSTLPTDFTLGTVTGPKTTGADGVASFPGLSKTLYIVTETEAPPATTGKSYTAAAPFAVTLPRSTADGTSWLYDVHVYPKNNKSTATKTVVDGGTAGTTSGTTASSTITYNVTTSIEPGYITSAQATGGTSGTVLQYYAVYDTFDARLTPPAAADVVVKISTSATPLTMGTDYTVTISGQKVTVLFTQAGLDKLVTAKNANPAANVVTTFPTTLTDANCYATPATGQFSCSGTVVDGVIKNIASFTPNQFPGVDSNGNPVTHPETPTNEVVSQYANLKLLKTNDKNTNNALSGAVFALYQIEGTSCDATVIAASTSKKIAEATTGSDGTISWNSIKTSTWTNGTVTSQNHNYCVVELKAPAGYVLPSNVHTYVALPDGSAGQVVQVSIVNAEQPGNSLPLTGGQGVAAVSVLALLLVGGGIAYYVTVSRRRREAELD